MKMTIFCDDVEVLTASITNHSSNLMEAVSTFETSVNIYQTIRRNMPADSPLQQYDGFIFFKK
jgi:hypothetical protein